MKIISWNCCLNLSKKFDEIKKLNPDILIIQECEELPEDFFPNAKYYRTGHTKNKGIGVVLFDNVAEIAPSLKYLNNKELLKMEVEKYWENIDQSNNLYKTHYPPSLEAPMD